MSISAKQKQDVISEYRTADNDSGSPEVQVALLTARIKSLSAHMRTHRHDLHSRRGLITMVGKRNRLLRYIRNNDTERYQSLIQRLGLRK